MRLLCQVSCLSKRARSSPALGPQAVLPATMASVPGRHHSPALSRSSGSFIEIEGGVGGKAWIVITGFHCRGVTLKYARGCVLLTLNIS